MKVDFAAMLARPSAAHWLGTDAFGRDVLSRLIYGSRTALLVGFGAAVVGATAGAVLGVGSAYFGGRVDLYLQRVLDIFIAFPLIILALAIVAILGNSLHEPDPRHHHSHDPALRPRHPVERAEHSRDALRGRGARGGLRPRAHHSSAHAAQCHGAVPDHAHVLPRPGHSPRGRRCPSWASGVQEPTAAWGLMLRGAAVDFAESAPWMAVFPGLAISLAVFAFNLFGDSLRDALDPKLRTL